MILVVDTSLFGGRIKREWEVDQPLVPLVPLVPLLPQPNNLLPSSLPSALLIPPSTPHCSGTFHHTVHPHAHVDAHCPSCPQSHSTAVGFASITVYAEAEDSSPQSHRSSLLHFYSDPQQPIAQLPQSSQSTTTPQSRRLPISPPPYHQSGGTNTTPSLHHIQVAPVYHHHRKHPPPGLNSEYATPLFAFHIHPVSCHVMMLTCQRVWCRTWGHSVHRASRPSSPIAPRSPPILESLPAPSTLDPHTISATRAQSLSRCFGAQRTVKSQPCLHTSVGPSLPTAPVPRLSPQRRTSITLERSFRRALRSISEPSTICIKHHLASHTCVPYTPDANYAITLPSLPHSIPPHLTHLSLAHNHGRAASPAAGA